MKKLLIAILLIISSVSLAGPRVTGNGGGGVIENGVYKTFGTAGVYVDPEAINEVPGSDLYIKTIRSLSRESNAQGILLEAALPMGDRTFYRILDNQLDNDLMVKLLAEYSRIVKNPTANLAIFAITNISEKATYLLPSFFKLTEIEQAAILFHEAYWIINPKATYDEVVSAEIAFQKFEVAQAKGSYDLRLPQIIGKILNDKTFALKSAYIADLELGITNTPIVNSEIHGMVHIGSLFLNRCWRVNYCSLYDKRLPELIRFSKDYQGSFFVQELKNFISKGGVIFYKNTGSLIEVNTDVSVEKAIPKALENGMLNTEKLSDGQLYLLYKE